MDTQWELHLKTNKNLDAGDVAHCAWHAQAPALYPQLQALKNNSNILT